MIDPLFARACLGHGAGAQGADHIRDHPNPQRPDDFTFLWRPKKILPRRKRRRIEGDLRGKSPRGVQFTVIDTGADGIPFAITTSVLAPVSVPEGTSKFVDTVLVPVATPIVL